MSAKATASRRALAEYADRTAQAALTSLQLSNAYGLEWRVFQARTATWRGRLRWLVQGWSWAAPAAPPPAPPRPELAYAAEADGDGPGAPA